MTVITGEFKNMNFLFLSAAEASKQTKTRQLLHQLQKSPKTMNETTFPPAISARSSQFIFLAALSCISGVLSICGNTVVLIAIFRTKSLHTISNYFIASLAVADLMVGIILNPILAAKAVIFSYLDPERPLKGSVFDKVEDFAWIQAVVATTFGLTAISIDRYIAVKFGFRYETLITPKFCLLATASVWLGSFVFASVRLFLDKPQDLSTLWLIMGVITCIFPTLIITFCYMSIFREAKQQIRKIKQESSLAARQEQTRRNNPARVSHTKTAFTVAIVILLFIILWVPSLATAAIQFSLSGSNKPKDQVTLVKLEREVWMWVSLVAYLSSASNPWVYSIRSREFRTACKKIFNFFGSHSRVEHFSVTASEFTVGL